MNLPVVTSLRRNDTHRFIPAKFSDESAFRRIAGDENDAGDLLALARFTDEQVRAEQGELPEISSYELVFGMPYQSIVNGTFAHGSPFGARFSGPGRGTWYAGFEVETSQAEMIFHKTLAYAEINRFDDSVLYDDYLADFHGPFHDLRNAPAFQDCLDPKSYIASQHLAETLLQTGSLGVVYPSVRRAGGTCIACFRPAAVGHVRRGYRYRFTWSGSPQPEVRREAVTGMAAR